MCFTRCTLCYSYPLLLIFAFLATLNAQPSPGAADTISWGRYLSGNQTIVSKEGNFELGFFSPGNSRNFYIGIWYKNIPKHTIIWVANREAPVFNTSSCELGISADGKLVLFQNKILFWSSNSTTLAANSSVVVLLDTGNLVLRDRTNSSTIFWQSFDHPTNTWLPKFGWLGMNKVTGEYQSLTSWKSSDDPSPGPFTNTIDPDGSNQFLLVWNGTVTYWTSGLWDGTAFSWIPGTRNNSLFDSIFVNNKERRYYTVIPVENTTISRNVLDPTGQVTQYIWQDSAQDWMGIGSVPTLRCDVYSACGVFGLCDEQKTTVCACSPGFEPVSIRAWNMNSWSEGCRRKTQLRCGNKSTNGENDGFLMLQNMRLPVNSHPLTLVQSAQQCKLACLNNCTCTAYAYTSGCLLWIGDIRNLQQLYNYDSKAGTFYLRLAAFDIPRSSNKKKIKVIISVAVGVALLIIIVGLTWISRRRQRPTWKPIESPLVLFSYSNLQRITNNFSKILGRGGFGSVFKGVLSDSTIVAVKKLEGLRQGEKQFRTEVSTLGTIQHVNLVRLRGLCCEGTKRLLVYDYMPKGSLDNYLFRNKFSPLDWRTRYQIILGIAKGLEYLHEKCRECIIHCDIKPENILIDEDFFPKVADFGMAKLLGREFSRVLTMMRGTIGYMAPEWTSGLPVTPKVDVYSYGMMLFEIISGRRNTDQFELAQFNYFPIWAARRVIEGDVLSILDVTLEGNADLEELSRVCKVACWCIQDNEVHRPSMGLIVLILEGVLEMNTAPVPSSLERLANYKDSIISS